MSIDNRLDTKFKLDDLTGGINTRDFQTEIEDKQGLDILNFNSSGNKLVTAKGNTEKYSISGAKFGGITIDGEDIWSITNGDLYKNGTLIPEGTGVFIECNFNFETISFFTEQSVLPYLRFHIKIDGVVYIAKGITKDGVINNLYNQLPNTYTKTLYAGGFFLTKPSGTITVDASYKIALVTIEDLTQTVYNFPSIIPLTNFILDGVNIFSYDNDNITAPNLTDVNRYYEAIRWFKDKNNNLYYYNRFYINKVYTGAGAVYNKVDSPTASNCVGLLLNGIKTISISNNNNGYTFLKANGASYPTGVYTVTLDGTTFSYNHTNSYDSLLYDGLASVVNANPNYSAIVHQTHNSFNPNSRYAISFYKNNLASFTSFTQTLSQGGVTHSSYSVINRNQYQQIANTFQYNIPTSTSNFDGITDITVSSYGTLVVDRDNGGASLYRDNIYIPIGDTKVGNPKCGTIYKGKVVLGGYGNDNIVFSKSATPTEPINLLIFSSYSAGAQSVSAGNKGYITGFRVGEDGLYVFKNNEIRATNTEYDNSSSKSFNFIFNKKSSTGALNQSVITDVQQDVFYYDGINQAVRRLSYEQNLSTLRDTAISTEIEAELKKLPKEQPLATASFKYPNYKLSLTDGTSSLISYNNGKTYRSNNITFVYNVYSKSWTIEKNGLDIIRSSDGYFTTTNKIYKDDTGYTTQDGYFLSKKYSFGNDISYKRFRLLELVGINNSVSGLDIEVYIDGVLTEIGDTINPYKREIRTNGLFKEKIELYDDGQDIQFKIISHGGDIIISDVAIDYREIKISEQYF